MIPFKYLKVPVTPGRFSKLDWKGLVEKITAKIKMWSSRHMSYARRVTLINTVLLGIYGF